MNDEEEIRCDCGDVGSHRTCPFATEIYDDYTPCNCCDKCTEECSDDV